MASGRVAGARSGRPRGVRTRERAFALLLVVVTIGACLFVVLRRKGAVDKGRIDRWDPPTSAYGFRSVPPAICTPAAEIKVVGDRTTTVGALEDVAASSETIGAVAVMDRSHLYFAEMRRGGGSIHRATRTPAPGDRWDVAVVAEHESEPGELTVGRRFIYWTVQAIGDSSRDADPGIRFYEPSTGNVGTIATEARRPERLVAEGDSVYWISAPNHLREWRSGTVRELVTSTLEPTALAVDTQSVFVFTKEHSLLRVPRNGSPPTVLVPALETSPVDVVVFGGSVFWLEQGPKITNCDDIIPRNGGYRSLHEKEHPKGVLRRVAVDGGAVAVVAVDLPEVQSVAVHRDALWVTTSAGLVRVDPRLSSDGSLLFSAAGKTVGRPVAMGDALALLSDPPSRVVLFATP